MKDVVGLLKKAAPLLLPSLMTLEIKSAVGTGRSQESSATRFELC